MCSLKGRDKGSVSVRHDADIILTFFSANINSVGEGPHDLPLEKFVCRSGSNS